MTAPTAHVVLVEDDDDLRIGTRQALMLEGFTVDAFADAPSALGALGPEFAGVVVSDIRMPRMDGIEFFEKLRAADPDIPVIFTTAHGDVDMAVDAMKNGAVDFFPKPFAISRLAHAIMRAQERRALVLENRKLRAELHRRPDSGAAASAAATRLDTMMREVAAAGVDVLIEGASGSGKSHIAREIHDLSDRRGRPFVVIDPSIFSNAEADLLVYGRAPSMAMSRSGLIERANGGTLVFEGIDRIPASTHERIASLVEHRGFLALGADRPRSIDIRIIATAGAERSAGSAWPALRERMGAVLLSLPTLAERREDVPGFFRQFVEGWEKEFGRQAGDVTAADWRYLVSHDWPGNLRELRTYAQHFVLGLTRIAQPATGADTEVNTGADTGASTRTGLPEMMANFERTILVDTLRTSNGSVRDIQDILRIPRKTLYDKLAKHGLRPADFRQRGD